jgi:predicted dehydrogenase
MAIIRRNRHFAICVERFAKMGKVSWGILSTASIGVEQVIPAMQKSRSCTITALASRGLAKAQAVAKKLRIPKAYGAYEELLADPEIEAVYIPLPNHMHVEWSIKALEAGKHVLCEKPIGLDVADAQKLLDAARQYPHLKITEAFMYRHHPQWVKARQLVAEGQIGQLRSIQSFFSFYDINPASILSKPEFGGGGLMDIGCYSISLSRFLFDAEPRRVLGIMEYDPKFKVDRLTSGILDFGAGTGTFTCSTQLTPYQRVNIFGTEGRVEIEIPFNAPPRKRCKIWHQKGSNVREIRLRRCDQYAIQGDLFSQAILNDTAVPTPLDDAVANMKAIAAVVASAKSNAWQIP